MKAILIDQDKNLNWTDVAEPVMNTGDVLISIEAAALNRADLLQRKGTYPSPAGWPEWMGLELAGTIIDMSEEAKRQSNWHIGDAVCALVGGGAYAERIAVPYELLMPVPKGLSMVEAASLPEAYATCYLNLFGEGRFEPGETLFFPAGASGLASVGIPMAKAFGGYVITSVLNADIKNSIAHLGADVIIDTSTENVADILKREAENGHPVDVAIDCLAGETIGQCFPYVNEGCRWVLISTLAGTTANIPLRAVLTRGIEFKGSMLRKRSVQEKAKLLDELVRKIWPKLESKEIRPTIYRVFPIQKASDAHAVLERGENIGKVVLTVKQ